MNSNTLHATLQGAQGPVHTDLNPASSFSSAASDGDPPTLHGYPDVPGAFWLASTLNDKHRRTLESESGIGAEAITARGYLSTSDRGQLAKLGFGRPQQLTPALLIPLWNFRGEVDGYALRPDIPRNGSNGKPVKYEIPSGARPTLDVAPLTRDQIGDPTKTLIITEGAKKADAAASQGLCALNLNGVWAWRGKNAQGGLTALPDWENIAFKGAAPRLVLLCFDSDVSQKAGVEAALRRLHPFLESRGARVAVAYLPEGPNKEKTGLDDFFARGATVADLLALAQPLKPVKEARKERRQAENAARVEQLKAQGLPVIETNGRQQQEELDDLAHAVKTFNAGQPTLFHGATGLALVEHDARGVPQIRRASREAVQGVAGKAARWIRTGEREGVQDTCPPRDLCAIFAASQSDWRGIPPLEGTATAPFFAPDGALCSQTGYHPAARLWLELPSGFDVGDTTPTPGNCAAARNIILNNILGEVAFADEASRAHAVALMLLPFVRRLIDGPTPLHLFDAPLRGSGKSYAAQLCTLPFGEVAPTPEKGNDEEWRKSLFALLLSGPSHIFLDNIKGALNSPALDAAITGESMQERATGTGEVPTARIQCVWVATANNAQLTEDAATRSIVIRLDPETENPDAREFHSNPKQFIRRNRAKVCGALLTLARAWQETGSPHYAGPNRCRFPEWAQVVGGILDTAQVPGFLDNLDAMRAALSSGEGDEWAQFAAMWLQEHGESYMSAKELLPLLGHFPDLAAQVGGTVTPTAMKLARVLARKRDRIFAGVKIESGRRVANQTLWRTKKVAPR